MNTYSCYKNKTFNIENSDIKIIKNDTSLYAGIFNIFWLIYHGMWFVAFCCFSILLIAYYVLAIKFNLLHTFIVFKCIFIINMYFFANEIREKYYLKQNFELDDIVLANSYSEAEVKYFTRECIYNNQTITENELQ